MTEGVLPGIMNLDTGELRRFQMAPPDLGYGVEVHYDKVATLGSDFEYLHYKNTSSLTFDTIEARYSLLMEVAGAQSRGARLTASDLDAIREDFDSHKRFMLSLCYPRGKQNDVIKRSPPFVLFLWPKLVAIKAKVVGKLSIKDTNFTASGSSMEFTVSIPLTEARTYRLTSSDIYRQGLLRESTA